MIPGIIPVGVSTPAFSYKEGFAGSIASGGSVTINMTTLATTYRWAMISFGGGQSSANTLSVIDVTANGESVNVIYVASNQDSLAGTGSATTVHAPVRIPLGSSLVLSASNSLGFPMNYTVGIFEMPVLNLVTTSSAGIYGPSPYVTGGPVARNGIIMISQFGQGGSGTWSDMTYNGATKIPAASPGQESLGYIYSTFDGTFSVEISNAASYNRVAAVSGWAPA